MARVVWLSVSDDLEDLDGSRRSAQGLFTKSAMQTDLLRRVRKWAVRAGLRILENLNTALTANIARLSNRLQPHDKLWIAKWAKVIKFVERCAHIDCQDNAIKSKTNRFADSLTIFKMFLNAKPQKSWQFGRNWYILGICSKSHQIWREVRTYGLSGQVWGL